MRLIIRFDGNDFRDPFSDNLLKMLIHVFACDINNFVEACFDGVIDGIIHDDFTAWAK